jgi:hypothetical protein
VHRTGQLLGQGRINHTLPLDPPKAGEGGGDDMDAKMGLPFGPRADMPGMQMGLVDDFERLGSERSLQLAFDFANDLHLPSFEQSELA